MTPDDQEQRNPKKVVEVTEEGALFPQSWDQKTGLSGSTLVIHEASGGLKGMKNNGGGNTESGSIESLLHIENDECQWRFGKQGMICRFQGRIKVQDQDKHKTHSNRRRHGLSDQKGNNRKHHGDTHHDQSAKRKGERPIYIETNCLSERLEHFTFARDSFGLLRMTRFFESIEHLLTEVSVKERANLEF